MVVKIFPVQAGLVSVIVLRFATSVTVVRESTIVFSAESSIVMTDGNPGPEPEAIGQKPVINAGWDPVVPAVDAAVGCDPVEASREVDVPESGPIEAVVA